MLVKINEIIGEKDTYLNSLSLVDFYIEDTSHYLEAIFPDHYSELGNIHRLR